MTRQWSDELPIYRQLYDLVVESILQGKVAEGEALLSVRQVAADYQINHLTVAKAYQMLAEQSIVEKRRGLGMFVLPGAQNKLTIRENDKFIKEELPAFISRARDVGVTREALISKIQSATEEK